MNTKNSFSSIISVNPYTEEYYTNVSNILNKENKPQYAKEQFVFSYLNTNSYIDNQIQISKNIPDEDVFDAINIKVYDELGLDQTIEYQIQYIETLNDSDDENRYFQVFLVNPSEIDEVFEGVVEKIKYIDLITPSPLLLKALYSKEIIEDSGVHCFIYFEENDAFISIYKDKEFVYTKSLKYSTIEMHERFCELYGERVDYNDFIEFLSTQSLKDTTSDYKEYILKLYKEIFTTINEILTYAKKAFEIEKVSRIYIGSNVNIKSKLYEIAEFELGIKSYDFDFDYGFEGGEFIDQIHALMHINASLPDEEKYICNFSSFHRPPKFIKRQSGKLLMLLVASVVIAFAYPATFWALTYAQTLQHNILKEKYNELHIKKITRESDIKTKEAEKAKVLALLKEEKDDYISKKNTLIKIHDVKVNYPMKAKLITLLTSDLNKYSIKLSELKYDENEEKKKFTFSLVSSKEKKITQLLEYLTKKHEHKFTFSLETISFEEEQKLYFAVLKVEIL